MKKIILTLLIAFVIILIVGYVMLFKPHMKYSFERIDSKPVTMQVEYLNAVGDPLCTKLYIKKNADSYAAVTPRFPIGLEDIHKNGQIQFGETVKLTGYRYQSKTRNRISRSESISAMDRVDVIAWESESN